MGGGRAQLKDGVAKKKGARALLADQPAPHVSELKKTKKGGECAVWGSNPGPSVATNEAHHYASASTLDREGKRLKIKQAAPAI